MTKREIEKGRKLTANFLGFKYKDGGIEFKPATKTKGATFNFWHPLDNWNQLMAVVDKIESIICHPVEIKGGCYIYWSYSTKKYQHFQGGQNLWNKWKELRKSPFDSMGGKPHRIYVSYPLTSAEKIKATNKKEATFIACVKFIEWYNKTVKSKK